MFFRKEVQGPFFNANFNEKEGNLRLVKNGDISATARQQLLERLNNIGQLFDDTVIEERKLPLAPPRVVGERSCACVPRYAPVSGWALATHHLITLTLSPTLTEPSRRGIR